MVEVTEVTVTIGDQQIYPTAPQSQRFFQKTIDATASTLAPGRYDLRVEIVDGRGQHFVEEAKGLRVEQKEEIVTLQTEVIAATPAAPAVLKMNYQSSGTGTAHLLVVDYNPTPHVLIDQVVNVDVGSNSLTLSMISNTGVKIPKGVYQVSLVYKGVMKSGNVLIP
jgi:hypothetical protein